MKRSATIMLLDKRVDALEVFPHLKLHDLGVQMPLKFQRQLGQLEHPHLSSNGCVTACASLRLPLVRTTDETASRLANDHT